MIRTKPTSIESATLKACLNLTATRRWRFDGTEGTLGSQVIKPYGSGFALGCYGSGWRFYPAEQSENPVDLIQSCEEYIDDYMEAEAEDRQAAYEAAVERGDYRV